MSGAEVAVLFLIGITIFLAGLALGFVCGSAARE